MLDSYGTNQFLHSVNRLSTEKQAQIIYLLVEGTSLRATSRIAMVSINTVTKLLVDVGRVCIEFHNNHVVHVKSKRIQCDEIWSFCYAKQKNVPEEMKGSGTGDVWTWKAIDADTRLIVSGHVGSRDADSADLFMKDVSERLANRVQLTTDGHKTYLNTVYDVFESSIDYAQLIKIYGEGDPSEKNIHLLNVLVPIRKGFLVIQTKSMLLQPI